MHSNKFLFILASLAFAGSTAAAPGQLVKGKLVDGGGKLKGKPVSATIATGRNAGRIAGPDDDERVQFIQSISFSK
ncbi:hypothetical protein SAMN05518865_101393 [Duganella sp. CF458]|uniref:hypothetical protein n=1 Tax=Duganella sp. CF458 TaxID=1884368 RepID=UPI0008EC4CE8|nr:hypothetical protein [Duganella sp. CF458]SFF54655.1 hypothetical protein SAMN05518865_101393 [Duganella sp. CF458]